MTGVSRLLALSALPWLVLAPGCGPITYLSRVTVNGASGDMAELSKTDAEAMSPYEYTSAAEYLQRAKELAGYARFHDANNFAKSARENAASSKSVTARRKKNNELPIFDPKDKSLFITKDGAVKRKASIDFDNEKPPGLDAEKPPLTATDVEKAGKKEVR